MEGEGPCLWALSPILTEPAGVSGLGQTWVPILPLLFDLDGPGKSLSLFPHL